MKLVDHLDLAGDVIIELLQVPGRHPVLQRLLEGGDRLKLQPNNAERFAGADEQGDGSFGEKDSREPVAADAVAGEL